MRLDCNKPEYVCITLSRRNLQTLISKVEREYTIREIQVRDDSLGTTLAVRAEPDEVHYADRQPPGYVHPLDDPDLRVNASLQEGDEPNGL